MLQKNGKRHIMGNNGELVEVPNHPFAHAAADMIELKRKKDAYARAVADGHVEGMPEWEKTMTYLHACNHFQAEAAKIRLSGRISIAMLPTYEEFMTPKSDFTVVATGERLPNPTHLSGYFELHFDELLPYLNKVSGYGR